MRMSSPSETSPCKQTKQTNSPSSPSSDSASPCTCSSTSTASSGCNPRASRMLLMLLCTRCTSSAFEPLLVSGYLSEWLCFLFGGASPWKDHMLILSYLLVSQCVFFLAHWLPLFLVLVPLGGAACFRSMGDCRPKLFSPIGPIAIGLKPWHCAL